MLKLKRVVWITVFIGIWLFIGYKVCFAQRNIFLYITDSRHWYVPTSTQVFTAASFCGLTADAIAHTGGHTMYIGNADQWHFWRDLSNYGYVWTGAIIARRIIVDDLSWRGLGIELLHMGAYRQLFSSTYYRIIKHGWRAYNDPAYNEHAIVYPRVRTCPLRLEDGYIGLGWWSKPLYDSTVIGLLACSYRW